MDYLFDCDSATPEELDLFAEELPAQETAQVTSVLCSQGYCWICWSDNP